MSFMNCVVLCLLICVTSVDMQESKAIDDEQNGEGSFIIAYPDIEKVIRIAVKLEMAKMRRLLNGGMGEIRSEMREGANATNSNVAEMEKMLNSGMSKIRSMEEESNATRWDIDNMRKTMNDDIGRVRSEMREETNATRSDIDEMIEALNEENEKKRSETREEVNATRSEMDSVKKALNHDIAKTRSEMEKMREEVTAVAQMQDNQTYGMAEMREIQSIMGANVEEIGSTIRDVLLMANDTRTEYTTKMLEIEADVVRLESGLDAASNEISKLKTDVDATSTEVEKTQSEVTVMQEQTKRVMEQEIPALKSDVDAGKREVSHIKPDLTAIRSRLYTMESKINVAVSDLQGLQAKQKKYSYAGWRTVNIKDKYWYFASDLYYTWQSAKSFCEKHGANLATVGIREPAIRGYIFDFVSNVWIGLVRNNQWKWIDSVISTSSNTPWLTGEPNNMGGGEDCAEIEAGQRALNDAKCYQFRTALCEVLL